MVAGLPGANISSGYPPVVWRGGAERDIKMIKLKNMKNVCPCEFM
jgi:hypothetical protein